MLCDAAQTLMHGHLDGELEPVVQAELRAHLAACPACAHRLEEAQALRAVLRNDALRYPAPADLRARIRKEISPRSWPRALGKTLLPGVAIAASWVAVALVSWNLALRPVAPSLSQEAVANHIRALMVDHAVDVKSSDQHTVKPWFTGKLGFSPPVPDLGATGYELVGGRLDHLGGTTVAALVYKRRQHVINLFIRPHSASAAAVSRPVPATDQGYHIVAWQEGGADYLAVSDLNPGELRAFARLVGSPDG